MDGHVRHCKLCQRQMSYSVFYMCIDCLLELEKVSGYVRRNPYSSIEEISQGTNLSKESVQKIINFNPRCYKVRKKV
ncbi:MAG TPA: hypothetical protein DCO80_03980 [Ornithinibacillus sp.]|uniref:Uncharacterized protein n=1 Tax=Ornithinibacillus bavariensis TaxID=545502 RepID=A0A919X4C3_9BACI|nr:hypothetical protein J43TS3_02520 [Ornithinibacillus bavariensis]HAM79953.1 hypothetical protein [Ornithinibacillus sp.]